MSMRALCCASLLCGLWLLSLSLPVALSTSLSVPDLPAHHSVTLHKDYSSSGHLRRRHHKGKGHGHGHVLGKGRHFHNGEMMGSIFATYLANVQIDNEDYLCILDTGSSDFAVAANARCGCKTYYKGQCDGVHLLVAYGDGNWTGQACNDEVSFGSLSSGPMTFAGMDTQYDMLECDEAHAQNGIIGLAYPPLLGPPANYTKPLMYFLSQNNHFPMIFGMQCCGWHHEQAVSYQPKEYPEYANGALDIGGIRKDHYKGPILWSHVYEKIFYAVDMLDVRIGPKSVAPIYKMPTYRKGELAFTALDANSPNSGFPLQTIVDSGTSDIVFTAKIYDALLVELKRAHPEISDKVWSGDFCLPHGESIIGEWEDVIITLAGHSDSDDSVVAYDLVIPPCRYMADAPAKECDNGIAGHAFSFERADSDDDGNILGQTAFEAYYIIHDLEKDRVGFALIDGCSPQSLGRGVSHQQLVLGCDADIRTLNLQQLKKRFEGRVEAQSAELVDVDAISMLTASRAPASGVALLFLVAALSIGAVFLMAFLPKVWRRWNSYDGYEQIPSAEQA